MSSVSRLGTPLAALFQKVHQVLGNPDEVFQVPDTSRPGFPTDVLIFRPPQLPFDLYLTLGVSLHPQSTEIMEIRHEYYAKVTKSLNDQQRREFAHSLWTLAQWPFREELARLLSVWHTLGDLPPLVTGSPYTAFLLRPAPGNEAPILRLQRELGDTQILEALGIRNDDFRDLHATANEGTRHVERVKEFLAKRFQEPVITDPRPLRH